MFLVHWVMFGVYCFIVFAFDSFHFNEVLALKFRGAHTTFQSVTFVLNFAIFFLPCVFASRVTWICEDILFKLNNMSAKDWNEGHPFRERNNVNAFLFYAERSRCGFRIRNITFGSSGTWISVLLGLFGFGLRLFQYFQWMLGQHPPNTPLPDWKMTDNPDPVGWITIIPSSCTTSFSNAFSSNYFRF